MNPLVSIGMSVFNCGPTLIPTIRSLLDQTYGHWELILIDDGSTDDTSRLVQQFRDPRIRVLSDRQNRGLPIRLNQAVSMSCGKYFARMDGGDIAYPERLDIQVRFLETHPEIDLVGSRIIIFKGDGRVIGTYPFRETHSTICRRPWAGFYLPHPTWMGRLDWFRAHPYREDMHRTEDQELLLRTYQRSRFACIPNILLGYCKDFLSLRNILLGRFSFSRALIEKSIVENRGIFMAGVFEQAFKALIEIFSIASGLNYRVLRRRALPVGQGEISQWRQVWLSCTQAPGTEQKTWDAEKIDA